MDNGKILFGRFAHLFFYIYDPIAYFIRFCFPDKIKKSIPENPKILLCCWASLGDVLLATSVIPYIRDKWPLARIGFLCAPSSFAVIEGLKGIDHVHQVPSWMVLGQGRVRNLFSLVFHFFTIYPRRIEEIKKVGYDMSIELHPFFPNSIPLMRRAKINRRIAFRSGGYDVWITDPVDLVTLGRYLPKVYPLLLKKVGIEVKDEVSYSPKIHPKGRRKVVLHMGTSDPRKAWQSSYWGSLGRALQEKGYEIVLTGKGEKDLALIAESKIASLGENLCDKLDFQGLSKILEEAAMVISIDSLPVHLAAMHGTPFIGLYLYNANVELWLPEVSNCYLLIHNRCMRRCKEKSHPRAIYLEEIIPSDVVSYACQLLGEIS
ncbi:MAG: glycosyltransferase family 9 protein [Chlamydiota bacterium]